MRRAAMKALGRFLAGLIVCAAMAIPEPALAAITRVGAQSASSGSGSSSSLTVLQPPGTAAGDAMVTVIGVRNAARRAITPPVSGGWVQVLSDFSAAAEYTQEVWFKVAGVSEPASYTWTWGSSDRSVVAIVSYRGVDMVVPINASGGQTNAAGPVIAPSINTTLGGAVLVGFFGNPQTNTAFTVPTGMGAVFPAGSEPNAGGGNNGSRILVADQTWLTGGATGTRSAGGTPPRANIGQMLALTPVVVSTTPFGFNCVEAGQDPLGGRLYTRMVSQPFSLDAVALRDVNGDGVADAVETNFVSSGSKNVTVELVDATSGAACGALPALVPAVSQTLTFSPADAGRKASAAMAVTRAYPNLRCRVTDNNQVPAVVGCSTDNFSVRPTNFTVTSTMNADAGGTSTSATPALNAGASFSVTATATPGYNGSPGINSALVGAHAGAVAVGALGGGFGSADPATGAVTGSGFAYSEVGYFRFQPYGVRDTTFTSVDQGAGDCVVGSYSSTVDGFGKVGCNFGNTANTNFFGRFVPDRFTLGGGSSVTPACASGFTYMGQPNLGVLFQVQAQNTANATTQNYDGGFARATLAMLAENADSGSDLSARVIGVAGGWASGVFNVSTFPSEAQATFTRPGVTPDGPFDALRLGVRVSDPDGVLLQGLDMNPATAGDCVAAGNCTGKAIGVATTRVRFGRLRLVNAHGSELLELRVPFFAQYWNGGAFALNALDACTSIPVASVTLANYQRNLNAGETVVKTPPASIPFTTGVGDLRLTAPGANNSGSVDLAVDLSTLPYLRGEWDAVDQGADGNRYDDDPRARATFGIFKGSSQIIYQRENY